MGNSGLLKSALFFLCVTLVVLLVMLVLFGAGAVAGSGKGGSIFAWMFATMQDEIHGSFTKEVSPPQKAAFDAEMKTLRGNLDNGRVSIDRLQPLLRAIREASIDSHVTPDEAKTLTKAAHDVNAAAGQRK